MLNSIAAKPKELDSIIVWIIPISISQVNLVESSPELRSIGAVPVTTSDNSILYNHNTVSADTTKAGDIGDNYLDNNGDFKSNTCVDNIREHKTYVHP